MSRDLRPSDGARFLLELTHDGGTSAGYRIAIFVPDAVHESTALLHDDGTATMQPTGAAAELDSAIDKLARLIARDAAKRRGEGLPAWPARILRWRR